MTITDRNFVFEQHLQSGQLGFLEVDYDEVFDAVADLSRKHGLTQPVRTADLLHVVMMEFGFDHFVTADHQQHQFAVAAGVQVGVPPAVIRAGFCLLPASIFPKPWPAPSCGGAAGPSPSSTYTV